MDKKLRIDLQKTPLDFMVASAHKFHGPKGVGFAYVKKGISIQPMLFGGGQEKGARSGTENIHAILGMEKALRIACTEMVKDAEYITSLKKYTIKKIQEISSEIKFNGLSGSVDKSSYTIISVRFPVADKMLLFNLDLAGIAVSGGSACQSGAHKGSHVLSCVLAKQDIGKASVRFSFSKLTTINNIDFLISILSNFFKKKAK